MRSGVIIRGTLESLAPLVLAVCPVFAQFPAEKPPLIAKSASVVIAKPGQMSLSPDGDRVAVAERFGNAVQVLNSRGELAWSVGEGARIEQPTAVAFASSGELIFSQWESRRLYKVAEKSPTRIDTLRDLSVVIGVSARILKLYSTEDKGFLMLTSNPDALLRFDANLDQPEVLIKSGSGKGRLDRPIACASLMSGRIAVAQRGAFPVQVYDRKGGLLFAADWNLSKPTSAWEAAAIATDNRARIWVADATQAQFRQYDPAGTLLSVQPFGGSNRFPADMAITGDNQLLVIDQSGRLDIYDLNQEN